MRNNPMWPHIFIIISFILFFTWFCFARKKDAIEIHETNMRIIGILVLSGLLSLWLCIYGVTSFIHHISEGKGTHALLMLPFIFPLISVSYSYLNLESFFRKRYKLCPRHSANALQMNWSEIVAELSERIGLEHPPQIAIGAKTLKSPLIFGKTYSHTILALPPNFEEILKIASDNDTRTETHLMEFILLHELAHIKNRDVVFTSWLDCFMRSFKYIVGIIILCSFLEGLLLSDDKRVGFMILMVAVPYVALLFLGKSFRQYRELLADARASLFMNKCYLSKLLESKDYNKPSPFEAVMVLCNIPSFFATSSQTNHWRRAFMNKLTFIFKATRGYISKIIPCSLNIGHLRHINLRREALRTQRYVGSRSPLPTINASFWNGLISGLAFVFCLLPFITLGLHSETLPRYVIKIIDIIELWAFMAVVAYIISIFSLPMRNSIVPTIRLDVYFIKLACRYGIAALASILLPVFLLTVMFVTEGTLEIDIKGAVKFLLIYVMAFIFSCACSTILYISDKMALFYRRKEAEVFWAFMPGMFLTITEFFIFAFWIGWFPTILGIAIWFTVVSFFKISSAQGHLTDRWIIFNIPLLKHFVFEKHIWLVINLFVFVILGLLGGLTVVLSGKMLGGHTINTGILEARSLYTILLITLLALFFSFLFLRKQRSEAPTETLRIGYLLGSSLRVLGHKLDKKDYGRTQQVLSLAEKEAGGFWGSKNSRFADMDTTWTGLSAFAQLGHKPTYKNKHIEWILRCENKDGGFAVLPKLNSRLSATFYALSSLSMLDSIRSIEPRVHVNWVKKWQTKEGGFHGPYSGWELLTDTYFAIGVLRTLSDCESIDREHCAKWALNNWRKGKSAHERTYYLVMVLHWLDQLSEEVAYEVYRDYLLLYAPAMAQLNCGKHPGPIFYYLSCAEAVNKLSLIKERTGQLADRLPAEFDTFVERSVNQSILGNSARN